MKILFITIHFICLLYLGYKIINLLKSNIKLIKENRNLREENTSFKSDDVIYSFNIYYSKSLGKYVIRSYNKHK